MLEEKTAAWRFFLGKKYTLFWQLTVTD